MYIVAGLAVAWIICSVGVSIWVDLYRKSASGTAPGAPSVASCADELDLLFRQLTSRSDEAFSTGLERGDWTGFSADLEQRLERFEGRCVQAAPSGASLESIAALRDGAAALDALRAHLARCGEDGVKNRAEAATALAKVRAAVRSSR